MEMIHLRDKCEFYVYCDKNQKISLEFYDLEKKTEEEKHIFEREVFYIKNESNEEVFETNIRIKTKTIVKCFMGYTTLYILDKFKKRYRMKNLLVKIKKLN